LQCQARKRKIENRATQNCFVNLAEEKRKQNLIFSFARRKGVGNVFDNKTNLQQLA
jgi:hypothetical protein